MLYDAANELVDGQRPALQLNGVSVYEANPGFHFVQPVILNAVAPRRGQCCRRLRSTRPMTASTH